jgi:thiamine kinase-like enzyme
MGWGHDVAFVPLRGGQAHESYIAEVDGQKLVVKLLSDDFARHGLMVPHEHLIDNTRAAGDSGVGARLVAAFPDVGVMVIEFIEGRTLELDDLVRPSYIAAIARALATLHSRTRPFRNRANLPAMFNRYLTLQQSLGFRVVPGYFEYLDTFGEVQQALAVRELPSVPCNNDVYAANLIDEGARIRVIDYDFSGMNDPCCELGNLAIEGRLDPDQTARLCEAYFGGLRPTQYARVRLFSLATQFAWALLYCAIEEVVEPKPDPDFDYWGEAEIRWAIARDCLNASDLPFLLKLARRREDLN